MADAISKSGMGFTRRYQCFYCPIAQYCSVFPLPRGYALPVYESDEGMLHSEEIQRRFKKVFGREMTRTEREVFFMPVEPAPAQADND
jgi:hypothetical protein